MTTLFLIGLFQSLFFATFLLSKKENKRANIVLGIWLIWIGCFFLETWINVSGTYKVYPHLSGIFSGIPFLHGPLLLLYTQFLISPKRSWQKRDWLHFLPFLIYYISAWFSFLSLGKLEKLEGMNNIIEGIIPGYLKVWGMLKAIHGTVYIIITLLLLRKYASNLKEKFSNLAKINLQWLQNLAIGFLIIYLFAIIGQGLSIIGIGNFEGILGLLAVLIILFIAFNGLRQGQLFELSTFPASIKYLHSRLEQKDIQQIKERIKVFLETKKPFLDPEFRLKELADGLAINPNDLSQVINEGFDQNFFSLINSYRVEEVKKQLKDPKYDHLTLLAIGLQCGFNSKTTFNTVFKKMAGQTPSEFKKMLSA